MSRKILMVAIAVFASYDIQVQSLLATLLVVVVLCVHSLACPYINEALDGLELLSLFGSFCTYFFGQFLFAEAVGKTGKAIVSFIIVGVNFTVILAVGLIMAGKGITKVAAFGRKFRAFICCEKTKLDTPGQIPKTSDVEEEDAVESDSDAVGNVIMKQLKLVKKKVCKESEAKSLIQPQVHQVVPASGGKVPVDLKI